MYGDMCERARVYVCVCPFRKVRNLSGDVHFHRRPPKIESRVGGASDGIMKNRSLDYEATLARAYGELKRPVAVAYTRLRKTRDINSIDRDINSSKRKRARAKMRGAASPLKMFRVLRYISKTFPRRFIRCQPASAIVSYRNT